MINKAKALSRLESLRRQIPTLKENCNYSSAEFKKWELDTRSAIQLVFPHKEGHVHRFNSIHFTAGPYTAATRLESSPSAFKRGLDEAGGILDSMIDEVRNDWDERGPSRSLHTGTKVFIGHGRSPVWKDLKDFIQDRLKLSWDEFNRVPVAGVTNIERLSEMLDHSVIAFVVMTGEDESADGRLRARENVVHEAGLFQGRLGFLKSIVLLEDGCEEFSNIAGLGHIKFPKGNINAAFEEIRRVLEREGLINL